MKGKEPVLLTVLIETASLRWYVAGLRLTGEAVPLVRSEPGNLQAYIGVEFDEQTTFLRHRLSGVLQRGCDRLWGREMKPCHIVFVADGPFVQASPELTPRVAEHFAEWMTSPPVVYFVADGGFHQNNPPALRRIAGTLDDECRKPLEGGLPALLASLEQSGAWETIPPRPAGEGTKM